MAGQILASPDISLELKQSLMRQVRTAASWVSQDFPAFFDRTIRETVTCGLEAATADEGTIWLIDREGETLIPVFNSGPNAEKFVGRFRQSLRAGMISMVVATEHPICENDVHLNQQQDRTLDAELGVQTCAMIAAPFYFAGELRGVVSGVQLRNSQAADRKGFSFDHLLMLQRTATLLGRLLEHRLIVQQLGIEEGLA